LAALDDPWRPARPFTRSTVGTPSFTNNTVTLDVELDGDGLLVVTEQSFPGWQAWVDGERAPLWTANMIFRGVPLSAGAHRVVLRYRPMSIVLGGALSLASAAGVLVLGFLAARARRERAVAARG